MTLRASLRESRDYAQFVHGLAGAAAAGDPRAQYLSARALKYCADELRRFFRDPAGRVRSLNEVQVQWARMPSGYQQEITDVYDRCHAFLDERGENEATS
jgi:hypothetical protein